MKLTWFHLQGYRDLPDDFAETYDSVWVDLPNALCDQDKLKQYIEWNLAEMKLAAELGFDAIGTNEHHQNGYGFAQPDLTAFHLAATTKDVAIVLLGMTLPIYNPLRASSTIGLIDVVSGGRLVAGWPVGTTMDVNHVYGVTPTETRARWQEAHDFIKQSWTRPGPFEFNGKYTKLRYVNPWPRPMQQPHPPIWMAGGGSVETFEQAARENYVYAALSYHGHLAGRSLIQQYWDTVEGLGRDRNPYRAGFAQIVLVADTDAEAEKLYDKHVRNFYTKAFRVGPQFATTAGYASKRSAINSIKKQTAGNPFSSSSQISETTWKSAVESGKIISGSPSTVREQLEDAAKTMNVGNWILIMQLQSMPHDLTVHNTRLFAEQVMPHVRDLFDDKWDAADFWPSGAKKRSLPPQDVRGNQVAEQA